APTGRARLFPWSPDPGRAFAFAFPATHRFAARAPLLRVAPSFSVGAPPRGEFLPAHFQPRIASPRSAAPTGRARFFHRSPAPGRASAFAFPTTHRFAAERRSYGSCPVLADQ